MADGSSSIAEPHKIHVTEQVKGVCASCSCFVQGTSSSHMSVRKIVRLFHGGRSAHHSEATRGALCQSTTVAVFPILELLLHQPLLQALLGMSDMRVAKSELQRYTICNAPAMFGSSLFHNLFSTVWPQSRHF